MYSATSAFTAAAADVGSVRMYLADARFHSDFPPPGVVVVVCLLLVVWCSRSTDDDIERGLLMEPIVEEFVSVLQLPSVFSKELIELCSVEVPRPIELSDESLECRLFDACRECDEPTDDDDVIDGDMESSEASRECAADVTTYGCELLEPSREWKPIDGSLDCEL